MVAGVFDFTLVLSTGSNNAHYKMIKVLNPTVELFVVPGCVVCDTVQTFFEQQPGLTLKVRRVGERNLRPPPKRSLARSADYPLLQYTWNKEVHPVPLPKLHDGAQPSTLTRRLHDTFYRKAKTLREHQKDLHKAFETRPPPAQHPGFCSVLANG